MFGGLPCDQVPNVFTVSALDLEFVFNGQRGSTFHSTPDTHAFLHARSDRLVLPGEKAAVVFFRLGCDGTTDRGENVIKATIDGIVRGNLVTLKAKTEFEVRP